MPDDLAGTPYWDTVWSAADIPSPVDGRAGGIHNHLNRNFHDLFVDTLGAQTAPGSRLLEIGCGGSRWLPYFAREFGVDVWGIDYSTVGCERARVILGRAGISGEVVVGDFFAPPPWMVGYFDVVVSFGVLEHHRPTMAAVGAAAKFLAPAGRLFTLIPNLVGSVGAMQRRLDRIVFDKHVPIDLDDLIRAHSVSGLDVVSAGWFSTINFGVINLSSLDPTLIRTRIKAGCRQCLVLLSGLVWLLEEAGLASRPSRYLSPYVVCVADRAA